VPFLIFRACIKGRLAKVGKEEKKEKEDFFSFIFSRRLVFFLLQNFNLEF